MRKLFLLMVLFSVVASAQTNAADNNRVPVQHSVSVEASQLKGKWNISKVVTPKHAELPPEKVSGSYIFFNEDGTYSAMILGVAEGGTWKFGPQNKNIHMLVNGFKNVWNILSYTESELIMQKGIRGNTVTFTR